nr:unnamed protein product [Meloidogyne enterolobii]
MSIVSNERHSLYLIPMIQRDQEVRNLASEEEDNIDKKNQRRIRRLTDGICC